MSMDQILLRYCRLCLSTAPLSTVSSRTPPVTNGDGVMQRYSQTLRMPSLLESLKPHSASFSYQLKTCHRLSFFFRRLWAPTITQDSWGQWPDSELGSRTRNTKVVVSRWSIIFRLIGGNHRTSSVASCSLSTIMLAQSHRARSIPS